LQAAYAAHPERFVRGRPTPPTLPEAVWINPPVASHFAPLCAANDSTDVADDTVEVLA
jgi:putative transposase